MTATTPSWLTDFVKALVKIETDERDACAKIAEAMGEKQTNERVKEVCLVIAAQIRARQ